jgi:hypothetical protein
MNLEEFHFCEVCSSTKSDKGKTDLTLLIILKNEYQMHSTTLCECLTQINMQCKESLEPMLCKWHCQERLAIISADEPMLMAKAMACSKIQNFQFSKGKLSYFDEK